MKKIIGIIAVVIIVILTISFLGELRSSSHSSEPIKIGIAAGLTGYAANWGEGEIKAYQLAYDEVKNDLGIPVTFVIENTKSDGLGTVNAIKKLIEIDNVPVILGPTWGDSFQGGFPIAEQSKVTILMPSGAIEAVENKDKLSYLFSTWWPQISEAGALVQHMLFKDGITKVVVIHDLDAFNTKFAGLFELVADNAPKYLATVNQSIPIGTTDFRTHIAKIKSDRPDAILVLMSDTSSIGTFMKQLKEQAVLAKVYSTTSSQNEDNIKTFPGQFDGLIYSFPAYAKDVKYIEVKKKLIAKYGDDVAEGPAFVNAYNAAKILFEAIKEGARTGDQIRVKLATIQTPGIGVPEISFDSNGQIGKVEFVIKTIKNNQFLEIE